jgi:hypothetical protein
MTGFGTFSFQSLEFYHQLGFRVLGELPVYPSGQTRYFLWKQVAAEAGNSPKNNPVMS